MFRHWPDNTECTMEWTGKGVYTFALLTHVAQLLAANYDEQKLIEEYRIVGGSVVNIGVDK
eukprot:8655697-Prorocentrum_lima.AAC.1